VGCLSIQTNNHL